jgi:hypothetical protein
MNSDKTNTIDKTYFIDIDGTILPHLSADDLDARYKTTHISDILPGVHDYWNDVIKPDDVIVLTTARPGKYRHYTENSLRHHGLRYDYLLMDLANGPRVLINDTTSEETVKATGINVQRDGGLTHLLTKQ